MKSKAQEARLFRGRGSVMRFWMFQRSDLAAQRGSKSLCAGLLFRGYEDHSARVGGRPARLARRSSGTGVNERSKWGLFGGGAWEAADRIRIRHELLAHWA